MKSALFVDFDNVFSQLRQLQPDAAERFARHPADWIGWLTGSLALPEPHEEGERRRMAECDVKLQGVQSELVSTKVDLGKVPRAGSKTRAEFDTRQILANWAGVDRTRTNGLGLSVVMKILSEIGPDLSRFANVKHFCSWLGLCPGTKISGGKVLSGKTKRAGNRVRQALKLAAMSLSHSGSALGAFYRRMSGRMDKPRANTATAHMLARMVYFMLTRGEAYVDQGQQHDEEQQRQRSIAALKRRAAALGFAVMPTGNPA